MDNQKENKIPKTTNILREYDAMRKAGKIPADKQDEMDALFDSTTYTYYDLKDTIIDTGVGVTASILAPSLVFPEAEEKLVPWSMVVGAAALIKWGIQQLRVSTRIKKLGREIDAIKAQKNNQR